MGSIPHPPPRCEISPATLLVTDFANNWLDIGRIVCLTRYILDRVRFSMNSCAQ
jgi:hypothetical protein